MSTRFYSRTFHYRSCYSLKPSILRSLWPSPKHHTGCTLSLNALAIPRLTTQVGLFRQAAGLAAKQPSPPVERGGNQILSLCPIGETTLSRSSPYTVFLDYRISTQSSTVSTVNGFSLLRNRMVPPSSESITSRFSKPGTSMVSPVAPVMSPFTMAHAAYAVT